MTPLPLLVAAFLAAAPAAAQDLKFLKEGAGNLQKSQAEKAALKASCTGSGPDEKCTCPGNRSLRLSMYAPFNMEYEFILDNMSNANRAYGKAGVAVRDLRRGLVPSITRARTGKDPELDPCFPQAFQRLHDTEDMCMVIKKALADEPPAANSLPVFWLLLTNSAYFSDKRAAYEKYKGGKDRDGKCLPTKADIDQIPPSGFVENAWSGMGTEANGITLSKGLKERCDAANVPGLPDTPMVIINVEPEKKHFHVLAHEAGHSIGRVAELTGNAGAKKFFDDIYPPNADIHNVMVTQREVSRKEFEANPMLNAFQVKALCDSPLLGK